MTILYAEHDADDEGFGMGGEELTARISNPERENGAYPRDAGGCDWFNSARVHVSPERDEINFCLSIDDPRGAVAFTVRRTSDNRIILQLPTPGIGRMSHVDLRELHEGTLEIIDSAGNPRTFESEEYDERPTGVAS